MSFGQFSNANARGSQSQTSIHNPDAIRRRKRKLIDHQAKNYQLIIENAMLTNLRTLKETLIKIYEYDVIIPKCHRANEVSLIIENEAEKISHIQHKEPKPKDESIDQNEEFEEILSNFDENEPILDKIKQRGKNKQSQETGNQLISVEIAKAAEVEPGRFFSNPLVYPTISALFNDIRFKTLNNVKPKYMIKQSDFQQINSFSEIKRGELVFLTDNFTMNK